MCAVLLLIVALPRWQDSDMWRKVTLVVLTAVLTTGPLWFFRYRRSTTQSSK
ncbi:MAG: hypothetical protein ACRYF3_12305 [Janthinobacterium lividum]